MSTAIGRAAETAAATYLRQRGFTIISQNWRTRWCEIDIVGKKAKVVYFVEVKYRSTNRQGGGLDYVTPRKLAQMQLAADFWQATHGATDSRLCAVELSGNPPAVTAFIDDIY